MQNSVLEQLRMSELEFVTKILTHKYKFREITMAHQNLDAFKSVISQVVPIGVLNQLQITKLIVSAPLCFPQI